MEKITLPLIFFSLFLFKSISGADHCPPASCSPTEPQVRFPFRIRDRQKPVCGFPGFDLSCDEQNRTILHLTSLTSYIVKRISYTDQIIYIDPEFCQPKQILDFRLTGTPFNFGSMQSYKLYNCSLQNSGYVFPVVTLPCLDSVNHSVIAVRTGLIPGGKTPENCQDMALFSVPIPWNGSVTEELELKWFTPSCRPCEIKGRKCGMNNRDTTCFDSPVSRRKRNKIVDICILVVTLITTVIIVFLICFWICCVVR